MIGGAALASLPASATTTSAPTVRAIAGNEQITVAWNAVASASSYTVKYSSSKSMSHATTVTTTNLDKAITRLPNGHDFWLTVSAKRVGLPTTDTSKPLGVTTHSGVPLNVGTVTATPAGANEITVHWTGGGKATKVGVMAGSDSYLDSHHIVSGWYPATTRTITLNVTKYKTALGTGSGNPVFIKVVQSNLTSPKPVMHMGFSDADKYRLSPPGTWALAGAHDPTTTAVTKVSIGELNMQSIDASADFTSTDQWSNRVARIAKTVEFTHPDVFGTAELSTELLPGTSCTNSIAQNTFPCAAHTQVQDFANHVSNEYALATPDSYQQVIQEMRDHTSYNGHVTDGAQIFYNPAKMTLLDHGYISPVFTLGVSGFTPTLGDRWLAWAKFQLPSGRQFIFVAAHFPVGTTTAIAHLRADEGAKAAAYLDRLAPGLPIVFTGDLNADAVRDTTPAATKFIQDGYFDAAATTHRSGTHYSTSNGTNGTDGANPGYPEHYVTHPYPTSRIDYIMIKNSPYTYKYENVMHFTGSKFSPSFQGTDHNLQYAIIGIGDPVATS